MEAIRARSFSLCALRAREADPSGAANRILAELWTGPLSFFLRILFDGIDGGGRRRWPRRPS
jgi:hypothetical protein